MTFQKVGAGTYDIDFGFKVDDRFAFVSGAVGRDAATASSNGTTQFRVRTFNDINGLIDSRFYIMVF
jgi:hypothetical protein